MRIKRPVVPVPVTSGELSRKTSKVIRLAQAGVRTPITFHGEVVAFVGSADDLKILEEAK